MRFLVVTTEKVPPPLEMAPLLMDAMDAWVDAHTKSGRLEHIWGFAGIRGGAGVANVESLEELHGILISMPVSPFQDTQVYGLTDIKEALNAGRQAMAAMTKGA